MYLTIKKTTKVNTNTVFLIYFLQPQQIPYVFRDIGYKFKKKI